MIVFITVSSHYKYCIVTCIQYKIWSTWFLGIRISTCFKCMRARLTVIVMYILRSLKTSHMVTSINLNQFLRTVYVNNRFWVTNMISMYVYILCSTGKDYHWLCRNHHNTYIYYHPKYVPYLMFPHPHDQVFKQSMVCFNWSSKWYLIQVILLIYLFVIKNI